MPPLKKKCLEIFPESPGVSRESDRKLGFLLERAKGARLERVFKERIYCGVREWQVG